MTFSLVFSRSLTILLIFIPLEIFAGHMKISLSQNNKPIFLNSIENPCNDMLEFNQSYAKWPSLTASPPWEKYHNSHLYQSSCFIRRLSALFERNLESIHNVTYGMIVSVMIENNCSVYLHGGVVRDILQGVDPHDIDGEYPCDGKKLDQIINNLLGGHQMFYSNITTEYFYIGNKTTDVGFEVFNWKSAFFDLEEQEYTPNSLYFDTLNNLIIDLSGMGVEDAIKKQLRIPVQKDDFDLWLFKNPKNEYILKKNLRKIPRFWKLRAFGYTSPENLSFNYLKNIIGQLWNDQIYQIKNVFFEYICIMTDSVYNINRTQCYDHQYTEKLSQFCKNLMISMETDLYDVSEPARSDIREFIEKFYCFLEVLSFRISILLGFIYIIIIF